MQPSGAMPRAPATAFSSSMVSQYCRSMVVLSGGVSFRIEKDIVKSSLLALPAMSSQRT
jgi:hypothetical protein